MSRQLKWQRRMKAQGRCRQCGRRPLATKTRCKHCATKHLADVPASRKETP